MMLDPAPLPVATVRTTKPRLTVIAHAVAEWVRVRATWLRVRTVPVIFGAIGAVCMLASGHYLKQLANGDVPAALAPHAPSSDVEPNYQGGDSSAPQHRHHHHHHHDEPATR
ncbi:MAG TPA: hypothetical protein VGM88_24910 [Kofleriaceae bacterium]